MDVRFGWERKLSAEELLLLNCGVGKTLESPLDCKEIHLVNPKENQSCIFIGRTDVEAESPILWPPDVKSWLIWKDPDAGKDWWHEKGIRDDEMLEGISGSTGLSLSKLQVWWCTEKSGVLQSMGSQSQTWLSYWTELIRVANFRARSLVLSVQSKRFQTDTKPTAHYSGHFKCCEKTALLHIGSLITL